MSLSSDLISQFVKVTKPEEKPKTETIVYGTVVYDGKPYVKIDGSDLLTPVNTTADVQDGERVTVMIKNHTATVTGNMSSPSARTDDVKEIGSKISEFDIIIADRVTTEELNAAIANLDFLTTENLDAKIAEIGVITAGELEAEIAKLGVVTAESLEAKIAEFEFVDTTTLNARIAELDFATVGQLEATDVKVNNLISTYGQFEVLATGKFEAIEGNITRLDTEKLSAESADLKYANINFSNIGQAAIEYFYSRSGLIEDLIVGDGTITGNLVGVTIKGDLIEAGTIMADKLVVMGDDGLYYKLNFEAGTFVEGEVVPTDSLHGSVITAKSITAEQVNVHDLVAFDATIGQFNITSDEEAGFGTLYSGVKESIDNSTRGIYMDTEGQLSIGDSEHYIRYFKDVDEDGNEVYKLEISAQSILFGDGVKSALDAIAPIIEKIKMGTYEDPNTGEIEPSIELSEGDTDFKQVITNTKTVFMDGSETKTRIDSEGIETDSLKARNKFELGRFVWAVRTNGNLGLSWVEETTEVSE